MPNESTTYYAPNFYPTKRTEIRAYTIAAFRVAQRSDQLSLVPMPKALINFLIKERAVSYWKMKGWLEEDNESYRLSADGLVVCQSALAAQLPTHNTTARSTEYWVAQFQENSQLLRSATFSNLANASNTPQETTAQL
jgi:hypothetical protein